MLPQSENMMIMMMMMMMIIMMIMMISHLCKGSTGSIDRPHSVQGNDDIDNDNDNDNDHDHDHDYHDYYELTSLQGLH